MRKLFLLFGLLLTIYTLQAQEPQSAAGHPLQTHTISGTVRDSATGSPIPRASIRIKGTNRGVVADDKGAFTITISSPNSLLVISAAGHNPIELTPTGGTVAIHLVPINEQLNDVVVVGYGTQKKATLTGAVATVSDKVFRDRGPISNPFESLQGQAPGVIVTRTSGQPGRENWNFQIRGMSSINTANPLVILDGVALSDNTELNTMNPDDIDNISFLKDAAASIYGSRAAYGVVLITTKRAKSGKPLIEYDASVSRKFTALMPHLLSIRQWGQGLMQATTNDNYGVTPAPTSLWYEEGLFAANPPDSGYIDLTALPGWTGSASAGLMYNGLQVPTFGDVKDL